MRKHQQGFSIFGLFVVLGVSIASLTVIFKSWPVYYENYAVKQTIENIVAGGCKSKSSAKESFSKNAIISDIKSVSEKDLDVDIDQHGKCSIHVEYQKEISLNKSISLLAKFNMDATSK